MKNRSIACLQLAVLLALSSAASLAAAQYAWVDASGNKQFSDMPPPPSVPRKNILKEPGAKPAEPIARTADKADTNQSRSPPPDAPMTTAERNADFQKRKMEQTEKDQKAADAAKLAANKTANCEKARSYARSLDDGIRIVTTDKDGERSTMSDEQRVVEMRNVKKITSDCP
ncbi:DUF4124 domain-containing protein [Actimicrobium antarcticum]